MWRHMCTMVHQGFLFINYKIFFIVEETHQSLSEIGFKSETSLVLKMNLN